MLKGVHGTHPFYFYETYFCDSGVNFERSRNKLCQFADAVIRLHATYRHETASTTFIRGKILALSNYKMFGPPWYSDVLLQFLDRTAVTGK